MIGENTAYMPIWDEELTVFIIMIFETTNIMLWTVDQLDKP